MLFSPEGDPGRHRSPSLPPSHPLSVWVGLGEGTKSLVGFSGSTEEGRRGEGPFFGLLWLTRHIHEEEGGSNEAEIGSGGVRGGRAEGGRRVSRKSFGAREGGALGGSEGGGDNDTAHLEFY